MISKILMVHNKYQILGGEDVVFNQEKLLLEKNNVQVKEYLLDNKIIDHSNPFRIALRTIWSATSNKEIRNIIRQEKPDVVHFHNVFPLISPSAYYAAKSEGVAVIQTLHNFRLICPNAILFRSGNICEACVGKIIPYPSLVYKCYRNDRLATLVVVLMLSIHRLIGTWLLSVDKYIVPSEFTKKKMLKSGIPCDKFRIKPNFFTSSKVKKIEIRDKFVYVGRLSPEKGIRTLLRVIDKMNQISFSIAGTGPLEDYIKLFSVTHNNCRFNGHILRDEIENLLSQAIALIVPSECFETFGLVIIEAFSCGVPVIVSDIGSLSEIVENEYTGLKFAPGNPDELARKIQWAWDHRAEMEIMGRNALSDFEEKYSPERNLEILLDIYEEAINNKK